MFSSSRALTHVSGGRHLRPRAFSSPAILNLSLLHGERGTRPWRSAGETAPRRSCCSTFDPDDAFGCSSDATQEYAWLTGTTCHQSVGCRLPRHCSPAFAPARCHCAGPQHGARRARDARARGGRRAGWADLVEERMRMLQPASTMLWLPVRTALPRELHMTAMRSVVVHGDNNLTREKRSPKVSPVPSKTPSLTATHPPARQSRHPTRRER